MAHNKLSIVVFIVHVKGLVVETGFKVVIRFRLDDTRFGGKKKTSNHNSEIVLK